MLASTSSGTWLLPHPPRNDPASPSNECPDEASWTTGNLVTPLVHGSTYFQRLVGCMSTLREGDRVLIADWRGDEDQVLTEHGTRLGEELCDLLRRGVEVKGLLWHSHPKWFGFNEKEESDLAQLINAAGGQMLLDERVRRMGSHHQKLVVLLHRDEPTDDVAFVGGIDLCHGRRDDARHLGDPQGEPLDEIYGEHPPWHDVQAEVRGPAVADLVETFRERWNDPAPLEKRGSPWKVISSLFSQEPRTPEPIPPFSASSAKPGPHTVQVVHTYPAKRPPYPFAPHGERSIARLYERAIGQARSLIYVEDQYFWSEDIARRFERALRDVPTLRLLVVVPRHPDRDGVLSGPANRVGQLQMMERLFRAGGDRVAVYDLENDRGDAIYVHAKVLLIDDVFAMIGSDNLNRRSWTHDSELSIAIVDESSVPRFARDLRLRLWREHLATTQEDEDLLGMEDGFDVWRTRAVELDRWYEDGSDGPRPPGRARIHRPRRVARWQRTWAGVLYRTVVDPDGRPAALRRSHRF